MKSAVFIASVGRPKQLAKAVNSVPKEYKVLIHCNDVSKDANVEFNRAVEICAYPEMSRDDRTNLAMKKLDGFNVMIICDDTRIFPDTISLAEEKLKEKFNGTMGVCGVKYYNIGHTKGFCEFAFCLYGNEWINQFTDRKMCSGVYNQYYIDYEWFVNAVSRGCWTFCEEAEMVHKHILSQKGSSEEYNKRMLRDKDIFEKRCKDGRCWGITEGCLNPVNKIEIKIVKKGEK